MTDVRDMDYFMSNPEAFEQLSSEDKASVFAGSTLPGDTAAEGDAAKAADSNASGSDDSPAVAPETETQDDNGATATKPADEPVVLAQDGKHTIPFKELATAREQAAEWERIAREKDEELKRLAVPAAEDAKPAADPNVVDLDALEDKAYEAMMEGDKDAVKAIRRQINDELRRQAEASATARVQSEMSAAMRQAETTRLLNDTAAKAYTAYPFLDVAAEGKNDAAIHDVIEWRDYLISRGAAPHEALSQSVAKFGPMYAALNPTQTAPKPTQSNADVAGKAAAAIAKAKTSTPTTLSDIPAGTAAHHDETAAMLEMGGRDLMAKFAGKTPEQIEALMAKLI
jgi:hypothetical protein